MPSAEEVLAHYKSEWETKIRNMQPGRDLDALVMRTVFKAEKKDIGDECYWVSEIYGEEVCWPRWFSPSTDIAAAWEVFELNGVQGHIAYQGNEYVCILWAKWDEKGIGVHVTARGDTAPEAICKAALLAVMEE